MANDESASGADDCPDKNLVLATAASRDPSEYAATRYHIDHCQTCTKLYCDYRLELRRLESQLSSCFRTPS